MKLIDDARSAWRYFSVQAMAWAIAIQGAWAAVPDDMKGALSHKLVSGLTMTLLVLGIVGRLIKQGDSQ